MLMDTTIIKQPLPYTFPTNEPSSNRFIDTQPFNNENGG